MERINLLRQYLCDISQKSLMRKRGENEYARKKCIPKKKESDKSWFECPNTESDFRVGETKRDLMLNILV